MKYSLTIHDLDADQVAEIVGKNLSTSAVVEIPKNVTPPKSADQLDGDFDSEGIPWDERIHAGSKGKNSDGRWKRRKGVSDFDYETITDELRHGFAAPKTDDDEGHIPGFARKQPEVSAPPAPVAAAPVPVAPPAPVAAPVAAAPVAAVATFSRDFQGLMQKISALIQGKQVTPDYLQTIVARVNEGFKATLSTVTDIANDPRMVEYAWQCIDVDSNAGIIKAAA